MGPRIASSLALVTALACTLPTAVAQDLVVEVQLAGNPSPPEAEQVLRATLRNVGSEPLELYLPEHHGLVPFPSWELQDEHGATVRPKAPSFQSMWVEGLQGEVLRLAAGAEASFDTKVRLEPGSWTATCTYTQERAEVPWGKPGFVKEMRAWPTLWTGSARSEPMRFHVGPYTTPRLTLRLPKEVAMGAPCALECSVLWPAAAGQPPLRAALEVVAGTKAYGRGTARWVWSGERWAPAAAGAFGALPPLSDSRWNATLDLSVCAFRAERSGDRALELAELVGEGRFYVSVAGVDAAGRALFSAQTDGRLASLSAPSRPGLELLLRASPSGPRHVDVVLRNAGSKPHRVPARLTYPRHLAFAVHLRAEPEDVRWSVVHDAERGGLRTHVDDPPGAASLPTGLAWSSAAFEHDARDRAATVLLAPGDELTRTVDLRALVADPTPRFDEPLVVRALWRQRARGVADGSDPPLTVGLLESAALELPGAGR